MPKSILSLQIVFKIAKLIFDTPTKIQISDSAKVPSIAHRWLACIASSGCWDLAANFWTSYFSFAKKFCQGTLPPFCLDVPVEAQRWLLAESLFRPNGCAERWKKSHLTELYTHGEALVKNPQVIKLQSNCNQTAMRKIYFRIYF